MTEADVALLICLADCINLSETVDMQHVYLNMVSELISTYTGVEKCN